jgi:hypothetical protein
MEAFMKKSKLFLTGILGILLAFGLVLTGCGGNDVTDPPDPPDPPATVADAAAAEQYFYDVWGTLSDEQKKVFIDYINDELPAGMDPIENLDDLKGNEDYWEGVKNDWDDIKDQLQEFVEDVKKENDTTPSGGGGNTGPKTLVITGISAAQSSQGQAGIQIGIYPAGTTPQQASSLTGIVAGASDSDVILSGSTLTVPLYSAPFGSGNRWTGSGTYDIYLVLGSGSSESYYRKQNVSFTSASTQVSAADFSPVSL